MGFGDILNKLGTYVFGSTVENFNKNGGRSVQQLEPNIIQRVQSLFGGVQPPVKAASPAPTIPTVSPSPVPVAPTPTSFKQLTPQTGAGFHVQVPVASGYPQVPQDISQLLGNELDKYGLATEAARVLTHPREQTYTPQEVQDFGTARIIQANKENKKNGKPLIPINPDTIKQYGENWNGGENNQFITQNTDRIQKNGTIDRGLMRENSQPFSELQGSHKWNTILKANDIYSFNDLNDPAKSIRYAKILGDYYEQDLHRPRWQAWFAAPLDLRTGQ